MHLVYYKTLISSTFKLTKLFYHILYSIIHDDKWHIFDLQAYFSFVAEATAVLTCHYLSSNEEHLKYLNFVQTLLPSVYITTVVGATDDARL